ncbi:hypothetical protein [Levyella massiliensis]|uniref:WDGH domain-containing protein n=1 Tax=Levyella massiliensis TaxID=938289 RepID=UPI0024AE356E|nr:hypothetical protein [Levyella massiliensis]
MEKENMTVATNKFLKSLEFHGLSMDDISDGYHTFDELYYHRMVLFSVVLNQNKERSWKAKKHADGTMYDNSFICGILTPQGMYTYHYDLEYWDFFKVKELERAPEWDGHKSEDVTRLLSL